MRIAVTYEDGIVFQHFGQTRSFKVYDVWNGDILAAAKIDTNGSGHGALVGLLKQHAVDALICGGIGAGAKNGLVEAGITLYCGVSGSADQAAADLITGNLAYQPDYECGHHGEHHHGSCGEHDGDCVHSHE